MRYIIEAKLEVVGYQMGHLESLSEEDLLDLFMQVFSLKEPLVQADNEMRKENERMKEELKRLYGVERPFICGDIGEADEHGMREFYLISPNYGANGSALYKKHKGYTVVGS